MRKLIMAMDATGDTRVEFDTADEAATAEARALFDRLTNGRAALVVRLGNAAAGTEDTAIKRFEELGEQNVIRPAIVEG